MIENLEIFVAPGIIEILNQLGDNYARSDQDLTAEERELWGAPKMCFQNAADMALRTDLFYVEGYAVSSVGIPLNHAWLINQRGRVIDPTWPKGSDYFGIKFSDDDLREALLISGSYGFLESIWHKPALKDFFHQKMSAKRKHILK